jgi:hypothetical protein
MGLLTDGGISTIQDLQGFDSAIVEVARVEGIHLPKKLELTEQHIALQLKRFVLSGGYEGRIGYRDGDLDLRKIVVTEGLSRWHALKTLEAVYGDAYYRNLNDRYAAKQEWFAEQAREAWELLASTGVGCVGNPVARAGPPELSAAPVPVTAGTYFVAVAWRNAEGAAGAVSEPAVRFVEQGEGLRVTSAGMDGSVTGYDVYVGLSEDVLYRQNAQPVPAAQSWEAPGHIALSGPVAGRGQAPEFFLKKTRSVLRG